MTQQSRHSTPSITSRLTHYQDMLLQHRAGQAMPRASLWKHFVMTYCRYGATDYLKQTAMSHRRMAKHAVAWSEEWMNAHKIDVDGMCRATGRVYQKF